MCFKERLVYQCGHSHFPVIRPCPQVTEDPRSAICMLVRDREFQQATMCVTCEKLLHNRWVLVQEALHRFDHERGICGCPLPNPPVPVHGPMVVPSQLQPENRPATQVDVRIAGLYAAEWLKDHGRRHETGQCNCAANFEPVPDPEEAELNADERALLAMHRQLITNPPPTHVLRQMQQQTGAPTLGMAHNHVHIITRPAPAPGRDLYPVNLGPGVFQPDPNTVVFGHNIDPQTVTGFPPAGAPPPYAPAPAYSYFPVEIRGSGIDGYYPDPPQGSSTPRGHGRGQRGNRGGRGGRSGRGRGRNGRGGAGRSNNILGYETTERTGRHESYRQQFGINMRDALPARRSHSPGSPAGHTERSFPAVEGNVTPTQIAEGATSGATA